MMSGRKIKKGGIARMGFGECVLESSDNMLRLLGENARYLKKNNEIKDVVSGCRKTFQ